MNSQATNVQTKGRMYGTGIRIFALDIRDIGHQMGEAGKESMEEGGQRYGFFTGGNYFGNGCFRFGVRIDKSL